MLEMLTAIKRAGADLILTYFAREAARAAAAAGALTRGISMTEELTWGSALGYCSRRPSVTFPGA